jgi:hypothetical protein
MKAIPLHAAGLLRAFVRKHFSLADLRHLSTLLDTRGWA